MPQPITTKQVNELSDYIMDNVDFYIDVEDDPTLGVFRTYSGRGMMGRYCLGIVINGSDAFELAMTVGAWLSDYDMDHLLVDAFKRASVDNMGMQKIYYWRSIVVVDAENAQV
jgi:hypothetical protein